MAQEEKDRLKAESRRKQEPMMPPPVHICIFKKIFFFSMYLLYFFVLFFYFSVSFVLYIYVVLYSIRFVSLRSKNKMEIFRHFNFQRFPFPIDLEYDFHTGVHDQESFRVSRCRRSNVRSSVSFRSWRRS